MTIRLFLADDHGIVRQGLRTMLEQQSEYKVIGEAADGRSTIQAVQELLPQVVILDLSMPELNGIDTTRRIRQLAPDVKVIVLSMHADRSLVQDALLAGASGYVLKESTFEELVQAIRLVMAGQIYLSQKITSVVVKEYLYQLTATHTPQCRPQLTMREREIWQLLVEGNPATEIAQRLGLSVRSIESYRKRLMEKLGARNMTELIKLALREGIIDYESM